MGAWITLWGRGFGVERGNSAVLFGDVGVTTYKSWTDCMIELQVPARARSGVLLVRTVEGDSPPYPFRVHAGNLWFVARNGSDDRDGRTEATAFRTLPRVMQAAGPGDVVYVRGGTWAEVDDNDAVWAFYEARSGTPERPVAFVGYPGEAAVLGNNRVERCFSFYKGDNVRPLENIVIAKFKLRPGCLGVPLTNVNGARVVGNEIRGSNRECQDGVIGMANASGLKILGNVIHDNGSTKLDHGIYVQGFGTNRDIEIAWNRVDNQISGRAIQIYGHMPGDVVERIAIHDNELTHVDRDGILVGWTDADSLQVRDVKIWNNIVVRAGRCVGDGIRVNNQTAVGVSIFHNTLVDNGVGNHPCAESSGEPGAQLGVEYAASVSVRNNILLSSARARCLLLEVRGSHLHISHNLLFGPGCGAPPTTRPSPAIRASSTRRRATFICCPAVPPATRRSCSRRASCPITTASFDPRAPWQTSVPTKPLAASEVKGTPRGIASHPSAQRPVDPGRGRHPGLQLERPRSAQRHPGRRGLSRERGVLSLLGHRRGPAGHRPPDRADERVPARVPGARDPVQPPDAPPRLRAVPPG